MQRLQQNITSVTNTEQVNALKVALSNADRINTLNAEISRLNNEGLLKTQECDSAISFKDSSAASLTNHMPLLCCIFVINICIFVIFFMLVRYNQHRNAAAADRQLHYEQVARQNAETGKISTSKNKWGVRARVTLFLLRPYTTHKQPLNVQLKRRNVK